MQQRSAIYFVHDEVSEPPPMRMPSSFPHIKRKASMPSALIAAASPFAPNVEDYTEETHLQEQRYVLLPVSLVRVPFFPASGCYLFFLISHVSRAFNFLLSLITCP